MGGEKNMEKFRVMFKPKEITATTPFSAYNKNKRHLVIVNSMKQIILIFCRSEERRVGKEC